MGSMNNEINKFRLFTFMYWAMMLGVIGMYTMYVIEIGFTKQQISITATVYTIASLIGQSFIGYLADKFKSLKKIIFFCISIGFIVAFGITMTKVDTHIYILMAIWGFFVSGTSPLCDMWTIDILKKYKAEKNFGRIRGFGSIGYGFSGALIGILLEKFGWKIYSGYIVAAIALTLLVILFLDDVDRYETSSENKVLHKSKSSISAREALSVVFSIKPLLIIVMIMFAYTFVMRGIYSYLGVMVSDLGGGVKSLGFTYFFDASPEIITFFLTGMLLKRFHSKNIIFAAFFLQLIRLITILIFQSAAAVIATGVLSGLAYGLAQASYKTYAYELAPEKYRASCMSTADSIIGVSAIISAPVFGFVFSEFGTNAAIVFGLVIYVIAILVMMKDFMFKKRIA